ncbi:hypothetical protein PAMP_012942 [Pampus punctatissimus]
MTQELSFNLKHRLSVGLQRTTSFRVSFVSMLKNGGAELHRLSCRQFKHITTTVEGASVSGGQDRVLSLNWLETSFTFFSWKRD